MPVVTLDINETGQVKQRLPRLTQGDQLKNTLLEGLYPGIRVARLNVPPGRLEDFQEALVENSMRSVEVDGVRYRLVGASGSAKRGKIYPGAEPSQQTLADRFRTWLQAGYTQL